MNKRFCTMFAVIGVCAIPLPGVAQSLPLQNAFTVATDVSPLEGSSSTDQPELVDSVCLAPPTQIALTPLLVQSDSIVAQQASSQPSTLSANSIDPQTSEGSSNADTFEYVSSVCLAPSAVNKLNALVGDVSEN